MLPHFIRIHDVYWREEEKILFEARDFQADPEQWHLAQYSLLAA